MSGGLNLLGLARRAGAVQVGEEPSTQAVLEHKCKLVLVASDAGASGAERMARLATDKMPVVMLQADKAQLGAAVGFAQCAACAITDLSFASAIIKALAAEDPSLEEACGIVEQRREKAQRRKAATARLGKKSKRKKT